MQIITGAQLPPIGWSGGERTLDLAHFMTVGHSVLEHSDMTKPFPGGLWCSPVIAHPETGQPFATVWTLRDNGGPFTLVEPESDARVAVIDSRDDLITAIDRWPDQRQPNEAIAAVWESVQRYNEEVGDILDRAQQRYNETFAATLERSQPLARRGSRKGQPFRIDWPSMAREIDAVYVTDAALAELSQIFGTPHLWGWDVPTILFLQPKFRIGERIDTPPKVRPSSW
jgi:hypothetical protein